MSAGYYQSPGARHLTGIWRGGRRGRCIVVRGKERLIKSVALAADVLQKSNPQWLPRTTMGGGVLVPHEEEASSKVFIFH